MRRKFNKLLLMSLVPLTIATAIPTVALSACAKSSKHGDQPKPSPTPKPTPTVHQFSLNDVGFADYSVQETEITHAKQDIRDYIHKRINDENTVLKNPVTLEENKNYLLVGYDNLDWSDFVQLTSAKTKSELPVKIQAVKNDKYLLDSQITFKVINRDLSLFVDLSKINLNKSKYLDQKSEKLREEINNKITSQLHATIKKTFENKDWKIVNLDQAIPKLLENSPNGNTFNLTIAAAKDSTILINDTHVVIDNWNYQLPKNYTPQEYKVAIDSYRTFMDGISNQQILDQVNEVTQQLETVNEEITNLYDQLLPLVPEISLNSMVRIDPKFNQEDFEKVYDILHANVNPNFGFWNKNKFLEFTITSIEWQKKVAPDFKFNTYYEAMTIAVQTFAEIKIEFYVHRLSLLSYQFIKQAYRNIKMWSQNEQNIIGNLAIELFCLARIQHGYENWKAIGEDNFIINADFISNDFNKNHFSPGIGSSYHLPLAEVNDWIIKNDSWKKKMLPLRYSKLLKWLVPVYSSSLQANYYLKKLPFPFPILSGSVTIEPVKPPFFC